MHRVCDKVLAFADLQMVNITLRVLSKPDVESLSTIYKVGPLLGFLGYLFQNDYAHSQSWSAEPWA